MGGEVEVGYGARGNGGVREVISVVGDDKLERIAQRRDRTETEASYWFRFAEAFRRVV